MIHREEKRLIFKSVALALVGVVLIGIYFFIIVQSPWVKPLRPKISGKTAVEKAKNFLKSFQLAVNLKEFQQSSEPRVIPALFQYFQFYKERYGRFPYLPLGYWRLSWTDRHIEQAIDQEDGKWRLDVLFDFDGNLVGYQLDPQYLKMKESKPLSEDDAFIEASYLLEELEVSTHSLVLVKNDKKVTPPITTHELILQEKKGEDFPHLRKQYTFMIVNDRIVGFKVEHLVDLERIGRETSAFEQLFAYLIVSTLWVGLFMVLIVQFIKKLRRDELEFRRATGLGVVMAILLVVEVGLVNWGSLASIFIYGLISGLFLILAVVIVFPIADSRCREVWAEKLELFDLLMQRKGVVRETGVAILRSFFLVGITLLLLGGAFWISSSQGLGWVSVSPKVLVAFMDLHQTAAMSLKVVIQAVLIGLLLLVFWPGYLKSKLKSQPWFFVLLMAITFECAGLFLFYFKPMLMSMVLYFPVALVWGYFVYRYDVLTVLMGFTGVVFFKELSLIWVIPGSITGLQGLGVLALIILVLGLGIYLAFRPQSVKDYEVYVPDYVSRIAERERFLKELEIARGVQMRFLPQKVPELPSLEIVSLCQPAMEVGGDYYDFIQMDKRYISVLIGDVSGKGVSAAFYMTMVKGIIKTLSKKTREPATLLAEANEIFYENVPRDVFITIIYGIFDLQEQVLTVASAGHNPLILWRHATGKTEMINPRGIALGLDQGKRYRQIIEEKNIAVEEGDVVVFYTDGVTEAMNAGQEIFGEERLRQIVERYGRLSPQQLQERIVNEVSRFSGKTPQHDDFTMVVIKVKGKLID